MRSAWSRMRNVVVGVLAAKAIALTYGATTVKAAAYGQLCCQQCAGKSYNVCCSDDWCGEVGGAVSCSNVGCGVECNDGTTYWNDCN
jgi:hypothetical protein